jgi:hypothetical protein
VSAVFFAKGPQLLLKPSGHYNSTVTFLTMHLLLGAIIVYKHYFIVFGTKNYEDIRVCRVDEVESMMPGRK